MTPLRVLHVTPYSGAAWAYGGIARLADTLAKGLGRRGHAVTVCTTDVCTQASRLERPKSGGRFRAWTEAHAHGVELRVFPNVSNRLAYHAQCFTPLGLRTYLKSAVGSFDVAHLHACRNLPGVLAARYLYEAGVPYVLAPNGTAPPIERRRIAKRVFDLIAGERVVRRATSVLAVSRTEVAQLEALGVSSRQIRLVPNPIDLDEFDATADTLCLDRQEGDRRRGPRVAYLGRISPRKNVHVLVEAFAKLRFPGARLVIAGNDMGAERRVREAVHACGIADRTSFAGLLTGRERLRLLASADVLVYPSADEIFGLVPLEALLVGTPVVVSGDSGCAEVIASTGGGQAVPVGDVGALARAIGDVLTHRDGWRRAAEAAACTVRAAYAPDSVCAQLEDVYREAVAAA